MIPLLRFFVEVGISIHQMIIFYSCPIDDVERGNIGSVIVVILDSLDGTKEFLIMNRV